MLREDLRDDEIFSGDHGYSNASEVACLCAVEERLLETTAREDQIDVDIGIVVMERQNVRTRISIAGDMPLWIQRFSGARAVQSSKNLAKACGHPHEVCLNPRNESSVTEPIALALAGPYLFAFEVVSVLLLAALIGAAFLARKEVKEA